MNTLYWRAHLNPVLTAVLILVLTAWLIILFRRQRAIHSTGRVILLLAPKALIVLLLIVAYFDPVWTVFKPPDENKKIIVLIDTSSSMDVKDSQEGSRLKRSRNMLARLKGRMRSWADIETLEFDLKVHNPEKDNQTEQQVRPTDLGQCLVTLADNPDFSDCLGAVLFTDGGDEIIKSARQPGMPVYITGVGSEPEQWNDLALTEIETPTIIEEQSDFEVTADIVAYAASEGSGDNNNNFLKKDARAKVRLEERAKNGWLIRSSETAALTAGRGRVKFRVTGPKEPGTIQYRLTLEPVEDELTDLNNLRNFSIEVRKKTLHVLFYALELGWDFRQISRELARDPSVALTALFRVSKNRFVVRGERQKGDRHLEKGFPADQEILDLYKCIIVGSFPAGQWRPEQLPAMREYVKAGGTVIFLGGEYSFGRGGYTGTVIEPLFPWRIGNAEPELQRGRFPVNVPATAADLGVMSEITKLLKQTNNVTIESMNLPGTLRGGALGLMNASIGNKNVSVVAIQRFGEGRTMGVATNTLWKWARGGNRTRQAYGHFWRQAVRYLAGQEEGGRFLSIRWDQEHYSPGEQAAATIHVAGRYNPGQLHLKTSLTKKQTDPPVAAGDNNDDLIIPTKTNLESTPGSDNTFDVEMVLAERGRYIFQAEAYLGEKLLERYEKTLAIGPRLNEGANLEVDHSFLDELAARNGGEYFREADFEELIDVLRSRITAGALGLEIPLVQDRYIYIVIVLSILVLEWFIRRRMNLT